MLMNKLFIIEKFSNKKLFVIENVNEQLISYRNLLLKIAYYQKFSVCYRKC